MILILFIMLPAWKNLAGKVELIEKIEFSSNSGLPLDPSSICTTEDELFLIPDCNKPDCKNESANIKVYERKGKFLELIHKIGGRKGYGECEFVNPTNCCYNKAARKLAVMDFGRKKIFIIKKNNKRNFTCIDQVSCRWGGHGIQLGGNKLYISGYTEDSHKNPYDFYYADLTSGKTTYVLPSYYKYGLKSIREYESQYRNKLDIPSVGIKGFFALYRNFAYFSWEGNLKIIQLEIVSGDMTPKFFGKQTNHYVKPSASTVLLENYKNRNIKRVLQEQRKMSYVRNIFVNSKNLLIIYQGPVSQESPSSTWLQYYTLTGDFIEEELVEGEIDSEKFWFDKEKGLLYSLAKVNEKFEILKYKIPVKSLTNEH